MNNSDITLLIVSIVLLMFLFFLNGLNWNTRTPDTSELLKDKERLVGTIKALELIRDYCLGDIMYNQLDIEYILRAARQAIDNAMEKGTK